jgi:hypothetical protein
MAKENPQWSDLQETIIEGSTSRTATETFPGFPPSRE